MALLTIKFQDISISFYSSVVPLLESLSLLLPLEELKEMEFHSHNLINHFIKRRRKTKNCSLHSGTPIECPAQKRNLKSAWNIETTVLVNVMK